MTPEQLVKALEELSDAGNRVRARALSGARQELTGWRAPGHRIQMAGSKIRVQGPQAPQVARAVAERAGKGAERSVRELLP